MADAVKQIAARAWAGFTSGLLHRSQDFLVLLGDRSEVKGAGFLPTGLLHRGEGGLVFEQPIDLVGEGFEIAGRKQEAVHAVIDDVSDARDVTGDDGQAVLERFDRGDGQTFAC